MRGLGLQQLWKQIDAAGHAWLGWGLPPPDVALSEAGWLPDAQSEYCGRCGGSVGDGEATASGCAACRGKAVPGDGCVRLGKYEGRLRDWVLSIKFHCWAPMGAALGHELGQVVRMSGRVDLSRTVVVPMPMPWQRRLFRGIDHAAVIASSVAAELGVPMAQVLTKENGPPQTTLGAGQRRVGWGQEMRVRHRWGGWGLNNDHIVLVDDVRTTGETVRKAARLIRQEGASRILVAVVAVADGAYRRVADSLTMAGLDDRGDES